MGEYKMQDKVVHQTVDGKLWISRYQSYSASEDQSVEIMFQRHLYIHFDKFFLLICLCL